MVHQVYVHGDSKKSCLIAVVVPELHPVEQWADKNGVQGDMESFCTNEKVKKTILDQMIAEGKKEQLKSFEQVKAITLIPEIFTVENGLLTPTLKFKRPALKIRFKQTFEDLYSTVPE
ncbi:hypothetical protein OS493_032026 [Desmophyllum pertusum]|uniref:Long-chain acyl-CoA synthetase n=1 Tax=Desmophyllum pertusum TaxID=174260 RepID=A0A9W9YW02_9CNID|nr:hypothetical protein OS493_032026 [Desmophyllum pertusum]